MSIVDVLFSFEGRIGRKAYFVLTLVPFVVSALIPAPVGFGGGGASVPLAVVNVACLVAFASMNARRLHDLGMSGAWQGLFVIPLLTLAGSLALYVSGNKDLIEAADMLRYVSMPLLLWGGWIFIQMSCVEGQPGMNRFGETRHLDQLIERHQPPRDGLPDSKSIETFDDALPEPVPIEHEPAIETTGRKPVVRSAPPAANKPAVFGRRQLARS